MGPTQSDVIGLSSGDNLGGKSSSAGCSQCVLIEHDCAEYQISRIEFVLFHTHHCIHGKIRHIQPFHVCNNWEIEKEIALKCLHLSIPIAIKSEQSKK